MRVPRAILGVCILSIAAFAQTRDTGRGHTPMSGLRITIQDADTGQTTRAAVCIQGPDGKAVVPEDRLAVFPLPHKRGSRVHREFRVGLHTVPCTFFASDGEFEVDVPAGTYTIFASKGLEYRPAQEEVDVQADGIERTYRLARWINMKELGWYSFDEHIHGDANEVAPWLDACDLNAACVFSYWNHNKWDPLRPEAHTFEQTPPPAISSMNQEVERHNDLFGAIHLSNMKRFIPYDPAPANFIYIEQARQQGATIGYAGLKGLTEFAVDMALGLLDYWCHSGNNPLYYHALNAGFKLPIGDGSRCGVSNLIYGNQRNYVKVDGELTYDSLFDAVRNGRTFKTTGAMVFLKINGRDIGDTIRVSADTTSVDVDLTARFVRPLNQVTIVRNGEVAKVVPVEQGQTEVRFEGSVDLPESSWFNVSVNPGNAQTSPIYVLRGDEPICVRESVEALLKLVEEFATTVGPKLTADERGTVARAKQVYIDKLKP